MANAVKNKLATTASKVAAPVTKSKSKDETAYGSKYLLHITAGPSYDPKTQQTVPVNSNIPVVFENKFMTTRINVRIRNYRGLPKGSPESCAYFEDPVHTRDQYSIGFSFIPKKDIESLDTVWGTDFANPIRDRLPPGFNTAVRIVKEFIDPGISCDAYADEPWLYAPSLSTWFTFRIGDQIPAAEQPKILQAESPGNGVLKEGGDGSGQEVRLELGLPTESDKRRKHFLDSRNREKFVFQTGRVYHGDFFNPYIDFNTFSLRLPGFSLSVIRYIDDKTHTLRWVFKNRNTGDVYFVVVFTLLYGDALQKALEDEPESSQAS